MSCTYYKYNSGLFTGDYWCQKTNQRVDDDSYHKYCRDYNYDECPIYNYTETSGCYITTIVCEILNHPDNNEALNTLRQFRDNILQTDKQYEDLLKEYDSIGPIIANKLREDKDRKELADILYKYNIVPISNLIKKEQYENAIRCYKHITEYLITRYDLKIIHNYLKKNNYGFDNYDQSKGGHGKFKTKQRCRKRKNQGK